MPVRLRSSVGPKARKPMPFKKLESVSKPVMVTMTVSEFTRESDRRIVTDSETDYESEIEAAEPVDQSTPKNPKNSKSKVKIVKPRRSTRGSEKRGAILTRAAKRRVEL